jgi:hypothetical protein
MKQPPVNLNAAIKMLDTISPRSGKPLEVHAVVASNTNA